MGTGGGEGAKWVWSRNEEGPRREEVVGGGATAAPLLEETTIGFGAGRGASGTEGEGVMFGLACGRGRREHLGGECCKPWPISVGGEGGRWRAG